MDLYSLVKALHIVSATILFGTGIGTAFFFLSAHRSPDPAARLFAARTTVLADLLFTTPAVLVQPATGAWLVWRAGFDWSDRWLVTTYILYAIAGACWLPVVWIQIQLKDMLVRQSEGAEIDRAAYNRLLRRWFLLGWPAFGGLVVVFWLMVAKPSW